MKKLNILVTGKQRGSVNVLAPVADELRNRGHNVRVYATGNEVEAAGFREGYERISPQETEYLGLVKGYDLIITGLSGKKEADGYFIRAAKEAGIPVVACQDQDGNYRGRFEDNPDQLPRIIALMDDRCLETMAQELGADLGKEAVKRARVVGWAAYDNFAKMREEFTEQKRVELLIKLGLNPENPVYFHATQNIHYASPGAKGSKSIEDPEWFDYEATLTAELFKAYSDLGLKLTVKPHPREQFDFSGFEQDREYSTRELARYYGVNFIEPKACDTRQLILASQSVSAGRSTCLDEACLLDRNAGGMLPGEPGRVWDASRAVQLGAIPYTYEYEEIGNLLRAITSQDNMINFELAEHRKRFSVDGKAAARIADLAEGLE